MDIIQHNYATNYINKGSQKGKKSFSLTFKRNHFSLDIIFSINNLIDMISHVAHRILPDIKEKWIRLY